MDAAQVSSAKYCKQNGSVYYGSLHIMYILDYCKLSTGITAINKYKVHDSYILCSSW